MRPTDGHRARSTTPQAAPRLARRSVWLAVAALLVLAACGADDGAADGDGSGDSRAGHRGEPADANLPTGVQAQPGEVIGALAGLAPAAAFDAARSPFPGGRIFSDAAPVNRPITADAPLHPDSERLVAALVERANDTLGISTTEWTIPAYRATADTPRYEVALTAEWSPYAALLDMPIPDGAAPDPEGDGHLAIVDFDGGWVWELWQARRTTAGWEASWGNRIALDSAGIYPGGFSARGSGFALLGGLIWPHELAAGEIPHALIFSTLPNLGGAYVAPATESDGRSDDPLTLPEGARLRLDPTLDLDRLDLPREVRAIARAMQEYGLYLVDNGSAVISLYAVHPASFGGHPAPFALEDGIAYLDGIPLNRLQLLDWGELIPLDEAAAVPPDPARYRR